MNLLVTGAAGFIGFHTTQRLLDDGHRVTGLDSLNDYYDPDLKRARLAQLEARGKFAFECMDICASEPLSELMADSSFDRVIHLAAQAGVRYSIEHPQSYIQSNLVGFGNVLEACRHAGTPHLVYASTSSVYGASQAIPFSEKEAASHPVSLYAATKRANELMAHSYSSLYGLPTTGLRFFTVYGPWGRPDMALFLFTRAILAGEAIKVFNYGRHQRDFTYIDDIVEGIVRVAEIVPGPSTAWNPEQPEPSSSPAPYRVYNIGNGQAVQLEEFIQALEQRLGRKAIREELPLQAGDVPDTWADCSQLEDEFAYRPETPVKVGIDRFVTWYLEWTGKD